MRDLPAAMDAYRKALELEPTHWGAAMQLGNLHVKRGERAQGLVYLEKAHALEPDGFLTNFNLGFTLFQMGRPAQAIPHIRKALESRPRFPMAWGLLGISLGWTKNFKGARAAYRQTLELNPTS